MKFKMRFVLIACMSFVLGGFVLAQDVQIRQNLLQQLQYLNNSAETVLLDQSGAVIESSDSKILENGLMSDHVRGVGGNVSGGSHQRLLFKGTQEEVEVLKQFQLSTMGLDQLHDQNFVGNKFRIAVVDSGIDPKSKAADHVFLFKDFTKQCLNEKYCDESGHGTIVSNLILNAAPAASIIVLKTLSQNAQGNFEDLNNALKWLVQNHKKLNIRVVNLSLTTPDRIYGYYNHVDEGRELIKRLSEEGVILITAVGNNFEKKNINLFPASSIEVISVGSFSSQFSELIAEWIVSSFSNMGYATQPEVSHFKIPWIYEKTEKNFNHWSFKPEIFALGENLLVCNNNDVCEFVSGTSYAAALVAGGVLSYLDKEPGATRDSFLKEQQRICGKPSVVNKFDHSVSCALRF